MRKYFCTAVLSLFLLTQVLSAKDNKNGSEADSQPVFVKEYLGQIDFVYGRILQLENEFSEESFVWGPGKDVRTASEVFLHVAGANKYFAFKALQDVQDDTRPEGMENFDKQTTDKAKVAEILAASFKEIEDIVSGFTEDDLNKNMKVFGMEMSMRNFMISMLNHMHEHLGQAIAYARMNGVVPPWSKSQNN